MKIQRLHAKRLRVRVAAHAKKVWSSAAVRAFQYKLLINTTVGAHSQVVKMTPELMQYGHAIRSYASNPWKFPPPKQRPPVEYVSLADAIFSTAVLIPE